MPEVLPRAKADELALVASAWKFRIFGYVSEEHTLEQISAPSYFQKASTNILHGNFVFITDKDGITAVRSFAIHEDTKMIYLTKPE